MYSYFFHVMAMIPLNHQLGLIIPKIYHTAFMSLSETKDAHDAECESPMCMAHSILDAAIFRRMPTAFMEAYAEADFKDGEVMIEQAKVWRNYRSVIQDWEE